MKKILLIYFVLFTLVSCEDITDLNENIRQPEQVPAEQLFSSAQFSLADLMTTPNVNIGIFRLLAQQWAQTTYIDESQYNLATRNITQNFWHAMYRDVLMDLNQADIALERDQITAAEIRANQAAMIEIMQVYSWSVLVETFGDIPYSEAFNDDIIDPVYDDAEDVYADLLSRLNSAISTLETNQGSGAGAFNRADLLYGGDVANWVKFGNSLQLRMGILLADVNEGQARSVVEDAAGNVFESGADAAAFQFNTNPTYANPVWQNLVQSGRNDFVPANTLVDVMNELEDPRREFFFTPYQGEAGEGVYRGGTYGTSNAFGSFSHVNQRITEPQFEALLLSYTEVQFYLAEAAARGWNVGGDAETFYNEAITSSLNYWGGNDITEEEIQSYLEQEEVAFDEANWRERIGVQSWIAFYNRGYEAWRQWRRLDYPQLEAPEDAQSAIPIRFTYPVSEQNLNTANYNSAANVMGGDFVDVNLFWDVE